MLGYKVHVLLYDFRSINKDPNSERRVNATTDEHYISPPYFDQEQAAVSKAAIVDTDLSQQEGPSNTRYADDVGADESFAASLVALQGQPSTWLFAPYSTTTLIRDRPAATLVHVDLMTLLLVMRHCSVSAWKRHRIPNS